ncbi:MAG: 50S ribosomal protein L29 [Bacteroidales bacterium]|jgi:large subunit ribosomal protein L29|nr:50S ribosomal protein L29 [Bacteroidales bacterium]MBP5419169.1 50S ribosomal protein L29 [Bacteroidales bacterium]MBR6250408.1 50S ribosomal protein L29 [Bacteroidales bacterium]MCR5695935.1 50S ribosomal protein L29 [Marinilabiliaceae bacterium]
MKASEIKGLTAEEIIDKVSVLRSELQKLELTHVVSPIENPMKIRHTRRDIARLLTILRQKQETEK